MVKKGKSLKKDDSFRSYLILILIVAVIVIFMLAFVNITTGYVTSSKCTDTDNGYMPFVKGTLTATSFGRSTLKEPKVDTCATVKIGDKNYPVVREYYCGSSPYKVGAFSYNSYRSELVPCPNGCKDGACIKEVS